jgi:hypothetical protein
MPETVELYAALTAVHSPAWYNRAKPLYSDSGGADEDTEKMDILPAVSRVAAPSGIGSTLPG